MLRLVLQKSERQASNLWKSLLQGQYAADAWLLDNTQKKLTLERFQREVGLGACPRCIQASHCLTRLPDAESRL